MEITTDTRDDIRILAVRGRLDSTTSERFEDEIYTLIDSGIRRLVIDLEFLDYISSAGLRVILKTFKDLKQRQGSMVLCSLQDYVREVFEIAGFDTYLDIRDSRNTAVEAC
jgi:anti-sigma B factor antagonist